MKKGQDNAPDSVHRHKQPKNPTSKIDLHSIDNPAALRRAVKSRLPEWNISEESLMVFVRRMQKGSTQSSDAYQALLRDFRINDDLVLGVVRTFLKLGRELGIAGINFLYDAARADNQDAICYLVFKAMEQKQLSATRVLPILASLQKLSDEGNNRRAMIMQALTYKTKRDFRRFEHMLLKIETGFQLHPEWCNLKEPNPWREFEDFSLARIYRELAFLHRAKNETSRYEFYITKAAESGDISSILLMLDDRRLLRWYSAKWYELSMAAATAGHAQSAYNIGMLYLMSAQDRETNQLDDLIRREIQHVERSPAKKIHQSKLVKARVHLEAGLGSSLCPPPKSIGEVRLREWASQWLKGAGQAGHIASWLESARLNWPIEPITALHCLNAARKLGAEGATDVMSQGLYRNLIADFTQSAEYRREWELLTCSPDL